MRHPQHLQVPAEVVLEGALGRCAQVSLTPTVYHLLPWCRQVLHLYHHLCHHHLTTPQTRFSVTDPLVPPGQPLTTESLKKLF